MVNMPMHIGAFSRRFNTSSPTVRYYIQRGLIIPETLNGQYLFNESCVRDMSQILEWKQMRLSLVAIHELLSFQRRVNYLLADDINVYLQMFLRQRRLLMSKQKEASAQIQNINALMNEITL